MNEINLDLIKKLFNKTIASDLTSVVPIENIDEEDSLFGWDYSDEPEPVYLDLTEDDLELLHKNNIALYANSVDDLKKNRFYKKQIGDKVHIGNICCLAGREWIVNGDKLIFCAMA